jgi:D-alanyl-D-alanine dipeptidase
MRNILCLGWIFLIFSACSTRPPAEPGPFRPSDLIELTTLDPSIRLDIRYATTNNFLGKPFYRQARAFLQRPAAEALVRANRELHRHGYGMTVFDGYRPWSVTKLFWDSSGPQVRPFLADPQKGSRHNRGCAVDLTLHDTRTGQEVEMTGEYDEPTERSYPSYTGGSYEARWHRDLLRSAMEAQGFTIYSNEWWHFDFTGWKQYQIQNLPFEALLTAH